MNDPWLGGADSALLDVVERLGSGAVFAALSDVIDGQEDLFVDLIDSEHVDDDPNDAWAADEVHVWRLVDLVQDGEDYVATVDVEVRIYPEETNVLLDEDGARGLFASTVVARIRLTRGADSASWLAAPASADWLGK